VEPPLHRAMACERRGRCVLEAIRHRDQGLDPDDPARRVRRRRDLAGRRWPARLAPEHPRRASGFVRHHRPCDRRPELEHLDRLDLDARSRRRIDERPWIRQVRFDTPGEQTRWHRIDPPARRRQHLAKTAHARRSAGVERHREIGASCGSMARSRGSVESTATRSCFARRTQDDLERLPRARVLRTGGCEERTQRVQSGRKPP
jgi:hypothetical protein